ncbi:hypothetical protein EVJ58_g10899 [Rhodofomes roseus]|uniref:TOG domain-containing protein n=1 Tax=Rhodofomes roseus TaxID=34475 RepID=A0A4Y9XM03_9APHY|nr:hypothetical protein EVJ58_g10899 [Rhodofomes roseus]
MAPKPPPNLIKCQTPAAYAHQLESLRDALSIPESEETWDRILHSMLTFNSLVRANAPTWAQETVVSVRPISRSLNNSVNSERSRLSGAAIELVTTLITTLGPSFEGLIPLFLPTLLGLCIRPNKVFQSRARQCLLATIDHSLSPSLLPYFAESVKDKSASLRLIAAECVMACLNSLNPPDLEKEPRAREIEIIIRSTATDASADVRKIGRKIFEAYKLVLPSRVDKFTQPLTPTIRKYLDIKPKPMAATHSNPQSRPPSAQSTRSNDGKLPPLQFSSSTSSLKPTSGTSSTQIAPSSRVHIRSASSSDLVGSSAHSTAATRQRQISGAGAASTQRSAAARTNMPPPAIVPSRSGRPVVAADEKGKSRPQRANTDPSEDRLFQSTPAEAPSRSVSSTTATRPDPGPLRPQGGTSGPRRAAPVSREDAPQDQAGRGRTGPIRPATSMAAMPPSRPDAADRPQRVVGGARRVPRMPPPETQPTASSDAKHGADVAERTAPIPLGPVKTSHGADARGGAAAKAVAQKSKPTKPAVTKANERAKPIPKTESTHRAGTSHGSTTQKGRNDKFVPAKRGGHSRSVSRDKTAGESKENVHERGKEVPESAAQPAEIPLPPSPRQNATVPPSEVPLPPSPQQAQCRPVVPKVEISNDPATPDRPRSALERVGTVAQTPISALVADIERGFLFTPGDPLSPAQGYAEQKSSVPVLPPLRALRTSRLSDITE